MSCSNCPCPETCLAREVFCRWAAKEPQDPVQMKAICDRSSGQQYPSTVQQARNLWVSVKGFVKSGGKLASKAERAQRLAICLGCEKYDAAQKRCRVCGCKNSAKAYVASDKCPLDKWQPTI